MIGGGWGAGPAHSAGISRGVWWLAGALVIALLALDMPAGAGENQNPRGQERVDEGTPDARMLADFDLLRDLELLRQMDALRKVDEARSASRPRAPREEKGKP